MAIACTEEVQVGRNVGVAGSDASGGAAAGFGVDAAGGGVSLGGAEQTALPPADAGACAPVSCGASPRQCGNCLDDDADGVVDANDPECLGPCDDSEAALFSGTAARVNGSCRADCYFDRNAGSGDDGCSWSMSCDPLSVAPDYPPTGLESCSYDPTNARCVMSAAEQSACRAGCLPLTPNGCDCFGCCELPAGSGSFKWLGSENLEQGHCELASSSDPAACRPCTPAPDCQNPCDECELCVGKPALPAACSTAGAPLQPLCPSGLRACDPRNGIDCSRLEYCITGCCVPLPT